MCSACLCSRGVRSHRCCTTAQWLTHPWQRRNFNDRGEKVEVVEGDRGPLVMESPPVSVGRLPLQDFEAEQAICVLGCELKAP